MKLRFYPPITTRNNLSFMICCENVVDIAFLLFLINSTSTIFSQQNSKYQIAISEQIVISKWMPSSFPFISLT